MPIYYQMTTKNNDVFICLYISIFIYTYHILNSSVNNSYLGVGSDSADARLSGESGVAGSRFWGPLGQGLGVSVRGLGLLGPGSESAESGL